MSRDGSFGEESELPLSRLAQLEDVDDARLAGDSEERDVRSGRGVEGPGAGAEFLAEVLESRLGF